MPAIETNPEPEVLIWARKSLGLKSSDVAAKLSLPLGKLERWEAGAEALNLSELGNLARIYKRSVAALLLPKPPIDPLPPTDLRSHPEGKEGLSSETLLQVRNARRIRNIFQEVALRIGTPLSVDVNPTNVNVDVEQIGTAERKHIKIDIQTQTNWSSNKQAFDQWRKSIEQKGILVFIFSMPIIELRGFSLIERNEIPVIVINSKDSINGRIFSLFHEYAHIILRNGGVCNFSELDNSEVGRSRLEQFCNAFAAAFLTPKYSFLQYAPTVWHRSISRDLKLTRLAHRFRVSKEVIVRRLLTFDLISKEEFHRITTHLKRNYGKNQQKSGRLTPAERCVRDKGAPFVATVLRAQQEGLINYSETSEYLGVRLKHLPKIREMLR